MVEMVSQGTSGWRAAHEALTRLARQRAGLDFEEGKWLVVAQRARAHARLGYGSFIEYIERLFGYSPRLTHDKLRVAVALESLPAMAQALCEGAATWSSVRELTRVATSETEQAWLAAARSRTVHDVERLVSGHRPGDLPSAAKVPGAARHVLRVEVSGEVLATFREAMAKIRRDAAGPLDDDAAMLLMARQILQGPADDGRASYQVAITLCEACHRARQTGRGEAVEVSSEVAAMAYCDAQVLPRAHAGETDSAHAGQTGGVHAGETGSAHAGETDSAHAGQTDSAHAGETDSAHAGETDSAHAGQTGGARKATQTVAPAVRRAVLRRDEHRCQVPGCRHATFVDVHHIRAREDGGAHEPENLLTLCSAHHRATHRGALSIEGRAPSALRFRHADGTSYGDAVSVHHAAAFGVAPARAADVQTQAFRALRALGFGEHETRVALQQSLTHVGQGVLLEPLLRHALALLTPWPKAS